MPNRISLDQGNVTLKELLQQAAQWEQSDAKDLTNDQVALINLKRVIELKDRAGNIGGGKECFICGTGA